MEWIITFIVTTIYELLALHTGFNIFGNKYKYLDKPLFKIRYLGLPLVVPIAWATTMIIFPNLISFLLFGFVLDQLASYLKWWEWEKRSDFRNLIGWLIIWGTVCVL